jgi:hypothetical protein
MQTTLYIGGVNVDLFEDEPILVNYSLTDVKEPASRKVSHTKTITLPNTANNASIFKQLFVINKDNTVSGYDPNIRVAAFVENGTGNCISGYFQLTGITQVGTDVKYTGVIYADEKNLFSQMGDKFLQGNTSSADDVELETGTTQILYQYGATEYSKTTANAFVASSNEGALFTIDSGTNTSNTTYPYYYIPYTNLRMALKFKHIWDRIFAKYNTTYSSTFLNSTAFKSMCYLDMHKTANLSLLQYNNQVASVNRSSDISYTNGAFVLPFNNELQDIGNKYNTSTGVYTVSSYRDYTVIVLALAQSRLRATAGPLIFGATNIIDVEIRIRVRKNGVPLPTSNAIRQSITIPSGTYASGTTWEFVLASANGYSIPFEVTWDAQNGDLIDVTIETTIVDAGLYPNLTSDVKVLTSSSALFRPQTNSLSEGDVYDKNSVPSSQHKQKDFIIDILRMFNLYLLWDGVNYIIEPRDTFYTLGSEYDWTEKIDRSQEISITPVGQLTWKQIQLMAKKDADYYSDKYFTDLKEVYGQQNVSNINEFVTDTQKVELSFAPPLSVSTAANYPKLQHMYKLNNGVAEAIDGLPRYGYWAGWKEEGTVFSRITGIGNVDYDGYAYVGEFNNPTNPTLSVLFGPPRQVFYQTFGILAITDSDLYTNYYNNELNNQVSANAKLITCYVYLTPLEINNLKLYDTVIIDGVRCIISKISDYNTTTIQPTQVELIQFIQ